MDRNNRRRPSLLAVPLVLALLPAVCVSSLAAVGTECPMDVSEPVTGEARLVNGTLLTGNPERAYGASQFRIAPSGSGFELCTCTLKPCVLKCCNGNEVWNVDKCTKPDDAPQGPLTVRWFGVQGRAICPRGLLFSAPRKCLNGKKHAISFYGLRNS